jgi:hypothetical protein
MTNRHYYVTPDDGVLCYKLQNMNSAPEAASEGPKYAKTPVFVGAGIISTVAFIKNIPLGAALGASAAVAITYLKQVPLTRLLLIKAMGTGALVSGLWAAGRVLVEVRDASSQTAESDDPAKAATKSNHVARLIEQRQQPTQADQRSV